MSDQSETNVSIPCVWVLSGSPEPNLPSSFAWIPRPDRVVAADGGSRLLDMLHVQPNLVLGDFDSIDPNLLARLHSIPGLDIRRFEHHTKTGTDTELAVLAALAWNPRTIIIFGAVGGRLDHSLSNILMLAHPQLAGVDVRLVEGDQEVFLVVPGEGREVQGRKGETVSLFPVGGDAEGVTIEGFEYPLHAETLQFGTSRGVSNVLLGPGGRIRLDSGKVIVIVSHQPA